MPVYPGKTPGTHRVIVPVRGQGKHKQKEESVRGTRQQALIREAELRLLNPSKSEARAGLTLEQWCLGQHLDNYRTRARASSWRLRKQCLSNVLAHLPGVRLSDVSTDVLNRAINERCGEVMISTVRKDFSALRHALRDAAESGHRVGVHRLKLPPKEPSRAEAYDDDQLAALFREADSSDEEFGRLLRWLLLTGLRRGEALAARWGWVRGNVLRIPDRDPMTGWRPKKRGRNVPLSPEALRLMRKGREKLWRWAQWPEKIAQPVWQEAGLSGCAHRLRHTFASRFLFRRPDLHLLGEMMGQTVMSTTAQYLHMVPGRMDQACGAVTLKRLDGRLEARRRK